ncbi:MAG TPA: hypothetical protein VIT91_13490 [Chthoniobacterales bacterium]
MEIALIDANGPFFRGFHKRRINWSKIPFSHLALAGPERTAQWEAIRADLATFATKVAALGYNAVSLDDLAHLADHAGYEPEIRSNIAVWREEFRAVFALLRSYRLRVFITADYLTASAAIYSRLGNDREKQAAWFAELVNSFLADFPEVAGVILRIGESDGQDVRDPLKSRLLLRSARQVNQLLKRILPIFEDHGRLLIFRTWTVGAYLIGDLIWHRGRLASALQGIESPAFVLSMKYGESDFFRYLPLNRHFFRIDLPKIIEIQARREYEGAGEYPSFIGWDCETYARELETAENIVGFSVWCQTGGWHAFRRLAFLEPTSVWIELNTAVAIRIFKDGQTVEQAISSVFGVERLSAALELLRRSDQVIRELYYIEEFARRKLFFRRVRIPPLVHLYWDCLFVNDSVRTVLSHLVDDPESAIRSGEAAFGNFERMEALAHQLDLPVEDIRFMRDTCQIILLARRYYLLPPDPVLENDILAAKKAYKKRWPRSQRQRYRIRTSFQPFGLQGRSIAWLLRLLVRHQRGYRTVLDRLFTIHILSWIYRFFHTRHRRALPKMMRKTAMGVDTLFK